MHGSRREFLEVAALTAAAAAILPRTLMSDGVANVRHDGHALGRGRAPFTLPPLPYPTEALEPYIDTRTMQIHHDLHHQAYVNNLNAAIDKAPELRDQTLAQLLAHPDTLPEPVRTAVRNNAGGHWNHSRFWQWMAPAPGGATAPRDPTGALADALSASFGSVATFRERFAAAAVSVFGSGWAWLVRDGGRLAIKTTPNQDNPLMQGAAESDVLLGLDVWEHAYYLKHQNRRAEYISAWWNVVNWPAVGRQA